MTTIKRCTSPEQAGWLELRMALWPAESSEHLPEMQDCCAQPGRYAQFVAYSDAGEAPLLSGIIWKEIVVGLQVVVLGSKPKYTTRVSRLEPKPATRVYDNYFSSSLKGDFASCLRPVRRQAPCR